MNLLSFNTRGLDRGPKRIAFKCILDSSCHVVVFLQELCLMGRLHVIISLSCDLGGLSMHLMLMEIKGALLWDGTLLWRIFGLTLLVLFFYSKGDLRVLILRFTC